MHLVRFLHWANRKADPFFHQSTDTNLFPSCPLEVLLVRISPIPSQIFISYSFFPPQVLPLSEGFQQTSSFETITFLSKVLILASHSFPEISIFLRHKMQEEEATDHISPGSQL